MSDAAENPVGMREGAVPSRPVDCWGGIGLSLAKHLAGSPIDVSETEFIAWAKAGGPPDEERRFALHEALLNMHADETRRALFDGRATTRQVAELVIHCGADRSREWNALIRLAHPELEVEELEEDLAWEKALMWESAGGGLVEF